MIIKWNIFSIGDKAYLHFYGGAFLCEITDVYMINNSWYYTVNCSNYMPNLELENISEKSLTNKSYAKKDTYIISKREWDEVLSLINN